MNIINFAESNSIINQYVAELRDVNVQGDRGTFRYNLQRIGQLMAYEVSKTLRYSEKTIQTPLAQAKANTPDDEVVLATVFRAGLPFHQGSSTSSTMRVTPSCRPTAIIWTRNMKM